MFRLKTYRIDTKFLQENQHDQSHLLPRRLRNLCRSRTFLLPLLDRKQVNIEVVHLAEQSARIAEAEKAGVKSVPALVVDGQVLHLNFGAALSDLK